MLIEHDADAFATDKAGLSALDHAKKNKHKPALLMLQTAQMVQLYHHLERVELTEPATVFRKPIKLKRPSDKSPA